MGAKLKIVFCVLFLLLTHAASAQNITVSIELDTTNKTQTQARNEVELLVIKQAINNMPKLIEGKETLSNDGYSAEIKAVAVAYIDVNVISENWDAENNLLLTVAIAKLDEEKSISLINTIHQQNLADENLASAYKQIEALLNSHLDSEKINTARAKINLIKKRSTSILGMSDTIATIENENNELEALNLNLINLWINTAELSLVTLNQSNDTAVFRVGGKALNERIAEISQLLKQSGAKPTFSKICGVSDYGLLFMGEVPYSSTRRRNLAMPDFEFNFNFNGDETILERFYSSFIIRSCY